MKIKTRLRMTFLAVFALSSIVGGTIFWGHSQTSLAMQKSDLTHEIELYVQQLSSLSYETFLFPDEERIFQQTEITLQRLASSLNREKKLFSKPDELAALDSINKDIKVIRKSFGRLNNLQKQSSNSTPLLSSFEKRLILQVQVNSRQAIFSVSQLRLQVQNEIKQVQTRSGRIIGALTFFLTAFVFVAMRVTIAKVTRPLFMLQKDFSIVAEGNLDHKTVLRSSDELNDLAQSFNQMTTRLKETMALREDLEIAQKIGHIGGWTWNIVSNELTWSKEIYRIFGLAVYDFEATYDAFLAVVHPDDREKVKQAVERSISEVSSYSINHRIVRPDGTERIVFEKGEVQIDDRGNPVLMIGTVQDITERMQIEKMLIQSEKMESVSGLAAGMSHELNNPLGAILQNTQNLNRRLSSELAKNIEVADKFNIDLKQLAAYMEERKIPLLFDSIVEAGNRASKIIKSLKSLNIKTTIEFENTNAILADLIENSIALAEVDYELKHDYHFKNIEIVREYDKNLPSVLCQKEDIENVILSILRNAAHAMLNQKGSSRITVRTMQLDHHARIEIEDNGPGMEKAVLNRIFEPFYTTMSPQKTGLGLSVAYSIICENHDGQITAESEPGKGTTIIIELPFTNQ